MNFAKAVFCYGQADVFANKPFSAELMEVENQLSYMQEELDAQHEESVQVLLSVCLRSFLLDGTVADAKGIGYANRAAHSCFPGALFMAGIQSLVC